MLKKTLLLLVLFFAVNSSAWAKDIPVQLEATSKISTANVNMQEGDNLNLIVANDVYVDSEIYIRQGTSAVGVITSLVNNGFTCQEASIYAESFRAKTVDGKTVKLKGIVHKEGRNHSLITQYMPLIPKYLPIGYFLIRGGEAEILPQKDIFTLYLESDEQKKVENNDL